MFVLILAPIAAALPVRAGLVGEWSLYEGNYVEHAENVRLTLEFHVNKSSDRLVATLWRSDQPPRASVKDAVAPKLAQMEIEFAGESGGAIAMRGEEPFEFALEEDENGRTVARAVHDGRTYEIAIVRDGVMEIATADSTGEEIAHYAGYRAAVVETVQADPLLRNVGKKQRTSFDTFRAFAQNNSLAILAFAMVALAVQIVCILRARWTGQKKQQKQQKQVQISNKKKE